MKKKILVKIKYDGIPIIDEEAKDVFAMEEIFSKARRKLL